MKKTFTKQEIIELYGQVTMGEISFSQMTKVLNERVSEGMSERVEEMKTEIEELTDLIDRLVKDEVLFVTSIDWDTSDKTMGIAVKFGMPNPQICEAFKKFAVIQESQTSSPFEWQWKIHP